MDILKQYEMAMAKKNELEKLVANAKSMIGNNMENKEDIDYLKSMMDNALSGKEVNMEELNKRVIKMTNGS